MPNFFSDNPDLRFHFDRLQLEEVVSILEHQYTQAEKYEDAPSNYEEAMELYQASLELMGDLSANFIEPRAMDVDQEGSHHEDGKVRYAKGTRENLDRLGELDFTGVIIPRKYGGINFPATIYMMMIEMLSRADASLMTLFGYQDVGEAIAKFGTEEVAMEFLPKYCAGEDTGAMVLTEPGAGSDLQAIKVEAHQDDDGNWTLRGVKHFISNGCGDVLLVLARSEHKINNIFGLSLFACHGGDRVKVTRIEEKMGLHGSPTCELYFDDAPARLVGKRRFGLIHVIHILNHARFSVAAQGLGIAEGAYQAALAYAKERVQFGKVIYDMPPVANMLLEMRVAIEASRTLLYNGSQWLDTRNKLEERIDELKEEGKDFAEEKQRFDAAAKIVDFLSPLTKFVVTEYANQICYDAVQLHGGMGFMREMPVERFYRDVRITSIYEGTTQVQTGLASKGVLADIFEDWFIEHENVEYDSDVTDLQDYLKQVRQMFLASLELVREHESASFREVAAKELVDMYCRLYVGYLLLEETRVLSRKKLIARRYITESLTKAYSSQATIQTSLYEDVEHRDEICEGAGLVEA